MRRIFRGFVWCALALAMTACATATLTRLAYGNVVMAYTTLGPMATWMIDDYVDLVGSREDWVRTRVDRVLAWHRAEELPRLRAMLETMLAKSNNAYKLEDIAQQQKELRASYYRLVEQLIPDTAEFLGTLDTEEIAQIERKLADDNRKYVRDSVKGTPEERTERRVQRFIGHLEAWVGDLEPAQRQLVAERFRSLRDISEDMMGERRFRQGEIMGLVRAKAPRAEMEAGLRRVFMETDSWRRPEYVQKLRERDSRMHALIADLSATLSERQRAALQKRIRGLLRDISTLTASS